MGRACMRDYDDHKEESNCEERGGNLAGNADDVVQ